MMPDLLGRLTALGCFLVRAFGRFCAGAGRTFFALAGARNTSRGGFVIIGVEPRTFEDDLGRGDYFLEGFLAALRTGLEGVVGKGLLALELDTTIFATIGINGHNRLSPSLLVQRGEL